MNILSKIFLACAAIKNTYSTPLPRQKLSCGYTIFKNDSLRYIGEAFAPDSK
jgi:hypothetical protein